ncbi:hypothetical protein ACF09C_23660 [Streptomyces sp. NPDC014870]|uniref:hypothetical protein n=1 Tax=Streptomyces sp. NPDC014870 TaxID=3364925 RepID=UPI0037026C2E
MTEFAPPTPAEIARAIALEQAYQEGRDPLPPARVREAVNRLYTDWQEAGGKEKFTDVLAFSAHVAADEPATVPNRGEVRALWSWRSQPEGAPHDVGHRFLAQACGESRGYQVLEDTPVGRKLESYELWDRNVQKAIVKRFGLKEEDVQAAPAQVWDAASAEYANAATGQVAVFAAEIGAESILGRTEIPRIVGPEGVGREAVGFPIEFPHQEHLPAELHDLMADPAVRCQLRREDYLADKSTPGGFAAKLASLDVPDHQKEALTSAVTQLSGVETYEELTAPSAEPRQPEAKAPELQEPELKQPEAKAPEVKAPEVKQPTAANAYMPGVTIPSTVTVPARRATTVSTHGTINPTLEAGPKSTDIER